MATPQLSPGVLVREVDLTVGRADNVLDNIGAIAGPFRIGPIDDPIQVSTEEDLINVFGKPLSTDAQYEYWQSASSFLSYGGVLKVCRTDSTHLNTANAGVGIASTNALKIKSYDDYNASYTSASNYSWAAKTPGSWGNGLKVCVIDDLADQTIGITTDNLMTMGAVVGAGVTVALSGTVIPGAGTTSTFTGYLKGIITGVSTDGDASASTIDVKIVSRITGAAGLSSYSETKIDYAEGTRFASIKASDALSFVNNSGVTSNTTYTAQTVADWYNSQTLDLDNASIFWKSLAPKPTSSVYATDRAGEGDGIHVAVVDDLGVVTGIKGNVLEKHLSLSKAVDAVSAVNAPQKIYYKQYIADFSDNVYAGFNPSNANDGYHGTNPTATGFGTHYVANTVAQGLWGSNAQDTTFSAIGNVTYMLGGGEDYQAGVPALGGNGGMKAELSDIITSYDQFANKDEIEVDYLIMGPGCVSKDQSQTKANKLIAIVNERKDCMATIGPHRGDLVNITNTTTEGANLGTGTGLFAQRSDNTLQFKSISAGSGISISSGGNAITITGTQAGLDQLIVVSDSGSKVLPAGNQTLRIQGGTNTQTRVTSDDLFIDIVGTGLVATDTAPTLGGNLNANNNNISNVNTLTANSFNGSLEGLVYGIDIRNISKTLVDFDLGTIAQTADSVLDFIILTQDFDFGSFASPLDITVDGGQFIS